MKVGRVLILIMFFVSLFGVRKALSQDDFFASQYVQKHFLIAASTKSYSSALKKANILADSLNLKLDLRGLEENQENGLTASEDWCEDAEWGFPCYLARGRHDDGNYISIEWSNAIKGFTQGYYVVIVSSQSKRDEELKTLLSQVRQFVPDAYIKSSEVYIGCMR